MNCTVNLVPLAQRRALVRARRRTAWIVVNGLVAVLLVTGWGVQRSATATTSRARAELDALTAQRAEVQRRLELAGEERDQLLARLASLGAARPPKPWPAHLAALTRRTPAGICLTALQIEPPPVGIDAPSAAPAVPAGARSAAGPHAPGAVAGTAQAVRLRGFALDHGQLIQMLNVLQSLEGWRNVELVRAVAEPFAGSSAVAFEFACRVEGGRP